MKICNFFSENGHRTFRYASVTLVEPTAVNRVVVGSSPTRGAKIIY